MKDPRNTVLASQLLEWSIKIKPGETLYLEVKGSDALALGKEVLRLATEKGATTFWFYNDDAITRQFVMHANEAQMKRQAELHMELMTRADCYMGIRGSENPFDMADVPHSQMENAIRRPLWSSASRISRYDASAFWVPCEHQSYLR